MAQISQKIGLLLKANSSPRSLKNRPIWSHWVDPISLRKGGKCTDTNFRLARSILLLAKWLTMISKRPLLY